MPIVGGIILAGVLIAVVVAVAQSQAEARPQLADQYPKPDGSYTHIPGEDERSYVPKEADQAQKALEHAGGKEPVSPPVIAEGTDKLDKAGMAESKKRMAEAQEHNIKLLNEAITKPDLDGSVIPTAKSGKPRWRKITKGKITFMRGNFPYTKAAFRDLQKAINLHVTNDKEKLRVEGDIGDTTLKMFISVAKSLGFTRYPTTIENLARNSVKWAEVLKRNIPPQYVGADDLFADYSGIYEEDDFDLESERLGAPPFEFADYDEEEWQGDQTSPF